MMLRKIIPIATVSVNYIRYLACFKHSLFLDIKFLVEFNQLRYIYTFTQDQDLYFYRNGFLQFNIYFWIINETCRRTFIFKSKSSDHNVEKRDFRMIDSCRTQTIMKFHILVLVFQYRAYQRGVQSVCNGPGP